MPRPSADEQASGLIHERPGGPPTGMGSAPMRGTTDEGAGHDPGLDEGQGHGRPPEAIRDAPARALPTASPAITERDDEGEGVGRRPDQQDERPRPRGLVGERPDPGEERHQEGDSQRGPGGPGGARGQERVRPWSGCRSGARAG